MSMDIEIAGATERIIAGVNRRIRGRRVRAGLTVGAAVVAVGALTAGALAVVHASQDDISFSARCFETAELSARYTDVSQAQAIDANGNLEPREVVDPVEWCGEMWRMGIIGQPEVPADPNAANFPVPELIACELEDGRGAAFPRPRFVGPATTFCSALGLADWSA